jgi:4-hydroxy-tetrahydrodipicolinate reductase
MKVAVLGAQGRMGSVVCKAIEASDDLELIAQLDVHNNISELSDLQVDVIVDFTTPDVVMEHISYALQTSTHIVVGTSGFTSEKLHSIEIEAQRKPEVGVLIVPNFSLGAILLAKLAKKAAPYFESVEIIELHHERKLDAPSQTARFTAEEIAASREGKVNPDATRGSKEARGLEVAGIPIHSIRLPGLFAHEEIIFGNAGEILTLRHDSTDRLAYMPGVLSAIREIPHHPGFHIGLDSILDL